MKFRLTKTVEAEYCTHEFLKEGKHLANHAWAIAKYKDGTYVVVNKLNNEISKEFKEKKEIYDNTWLITLLDGTQCIMYYDKDEIKISKPFLRLIKVFVRFALIENMEGKRKLVFRSVNFFSQEFNWFTGESSCEFKVGELPNGKKTILKKEGLEVLDFEFDDYIFSAHIKNIVIIVKDGQESLIRISDFKRSGYYFDITCFNASDKPIDVVEYAIITCRNKGKAVMRIKDFATSYIYDEIKPIGNEYALVKGYSGKEQILRLSDYCVAKF